MFSVVWRFFPGPVWLRIIVLILLAAVLVWLVIEYVYPWVNSMIPDTESTVAT